MLQGFEEYTEDLNDYEKKKLLPSFVSSLARRKGVENAITSKEIVSIFRDRSVELTDVKVRKIVSYIRSNCLIDGLVASSKGYYVTEDPEEVARWLESMDGRIAKMQFNRDKMRLYHNSLLQKRIKQQDLFNQ